MAEARTRLERVLGSTQLPGLEDLLVETLALSTPSGGEQLSRAVAARWLRQRATARMRVVTLQRHQHQALIMATTQGWQTVAPLSSGHLGLTLRRYAATGAQDPEHGEWQIDVLEIQ